MGPIVQRFDGPRGWVLRLALTCAAITILLPLAILLLAGLIVGMTVFIVLSLMASLLEMLGLGGAREQRQPPGDHERRNVRVIDTE